jgi:EpsD family peptidyl-prolyl cis-trans isomerase
VSTRGGAIAGCRRRARGRNNARRRVNIGCDDYTRDYRFVVTWLLVVTLSGCGSGATPGSANPAADRLVVVNGDNITLRQFQDQYSAMRVRAQTDAKSLDRYVLQSLVDEQLLAQKATADQLDKDPPVMRALERARRQILAQAAIDHAGGEIEVSAAEARKFYADNPNLFEKRKIYIFCQFVLDAAGLDESVKRRLEHAKAPAQVAASLADAKIKFSYQNEVQAAEALPREILEQAARMKSGDILVRKNGNQTVLMQLVNEVLEPIDVAKAMPAIRIYLAFDRRGDRTETLLKGLRRNASIKYADGYSGSAGDIATSVATKPLSAAVTSGNESSVGKRALNLRN